MCNMTSTLYVDVMSLLKQVVTTTVVAKRVRTFCYFIKKRTNDSETTKQIMKNS